MLREAQLRVTRPRIAVLDLLERHPHADADTIAREARTGLGKVSTQAIYDVLSALTAAGLVRRIEPAGSPARYELRVGDNHHHLVCRSCGTIVDVDCAVGDRPCLHASDDHGFEIDEAEVIYWGRCPACIAGQTSGPVRAAGSDGAGTPGMSRAGRGQAGQRLRVSRRDGRIGADRHPLVEDRGAAVHVDHVCQDGSANRVAEQDGQGLADQGM